MNGWAFPVAVMIITGYAAFYATLALVWVYRRYQHRRFLKVKAEKRITFDRPMVWQAIRVEQDENGTTIIGRFAPVDSDILDICRQIESQS